MPCFWNGFLRCAIIDRKAKRKRVETMGNIVSIILVVLMALLGGLPTIYLTVSIPVVIGQKIYRKVKYGCSMFD